MDNESSNHAMLAGRHALVTGGGSGIGAAIALALAGEGARVTITGRRRAALEALSEAHPGLELHPLEMDVRDEESVTTAVSAAIAARGAIHICVANAGIAEGRPLAKTTLAEWRRILETNLDGAFLTIRACLEPMRAAGWGRVIAVSSIAGLKGLRNAPAYTASKHGLIGLVRALSEELIGAPVTANALCPGYADTAIVADNAARLAAATGKSEGEIRARMAAGNRHNRLLAPEEIAAAALWLCDPRAGSVNGQAIEIAGGQM